MPDESASGIGTAHGIEIGVLAFAQVATHRNSLQHIAQRREALISCCAGFSSAAIPDVSWPAGSFFRTRQEVLRLEIDHSSQAYVA